MFDGDSHKETSGPDDTLINYDVNEIVTEYPAKHLSDSLEKRQPLLLWDSLRHQKDGNYTTRCLNINFTPSLVSLTFWILKFQEIIQKHRGNIITDILEALNGELKTMSEIISKNTRMIFINSRPTNRPMGCQTSLIK